MSHRREYDREYQRKYRESHPEKMAEYNRTQMERRRARRVVRQGVCARCGKTFEVGIGKRMTKYCSHTCMKREMTLRQMAKERAKREANTVPPPVPGRGVSKPLLPAAPETGCGTDKSVASPWLKACVVCGKVFTASRCTALTCSSKCRKKRYRAKHPVVKPPKAECPKVERRDSFGLTREQRLAVIAAQDGDRDALWNASQSWTPEQHKFAKARWESLHPIHKDFSWGRY